MQTLDTSLYRLLAVPCNLLRRPWLLLLAAPFVLLLLHIAGGCDPDCRIVMRNRYAVPVVVEHLDNPARNMPEQMLDTLQPGERKELGGTAGLDGDIDNIVIKDTRGNTLARLDHSHDNVINKSTVSQTAWDITIGP